MLLIGPTANFAGVGKHGLPAKADTGVEEVSAEELDCLIVPGGWAPDFWRRFDSFKDLVRGVAGNPSKVLACICHGGWLLASANVVRGKRMTCFHAIKDDMVNAGADYVDEEVVVDGNLITARVPDDLGAFCRAILTALQKRS